MSVEALKQAMLAKSAEKLPDNEDETNRGVNNVRKAPEGRAPGTLNAKWGDAPPAPDTHGEAVVQEALDGRNEMIERLFDSPKTTAPVEQALMNDLFTNAVEGNAPHSPMLQRKRLRLTSTAEPTLTDQVMRIAGRR